MALDKAYAWPGRKDGVEEGYEDFVRASGAEGEEKRSLDGFGSGLFLCIG
jgi:hypothetical protein